MLVDIELRHLRYFVAVADNGGFTAASRRLHIAQQVLSTQIRQLEDALGLVLFHRTSRGVRLTAAGENLQAEARNMFDQMERALAVTRQVSRAGSGRLSVGMNVSASGDVPSTVLPSVSPSRSA